MHTFPIYIVYDTYADSHRLIGAYTDKSIAEKIILGKSYKIETVNLNHVFLGVLNAVEKVHGKNIKTIVANNTIII